MFLLYPEFRTVAIKFHVNVHVYAQVHVQVQAHLNLHVNIVQVHAHQCAGTCTYSCICSRTPECTFTYYILLVTK